MVYAPLWHPVEVSGMVELMQGRLLEPRALFAKLAANLVGPDAVQAAVGSQEIGPLDTHPSLAARHAGLGLGEGDLALSMLCRPPARPASSLFGDMRDLGQRLFMTHVQALALSGAFEDGPMAPIDLSPPATEQGQSQVP